MYNLNEVSLLIIDEAHRCLKNYDYTKVVKKYKEQSNHPRILGLTASPGSDLEKVNEKLIKPHETYIFILPFKDKKNWRISHKYKMRYNYETQKEG